MGNDVTGILAKIRAARQFTETLPNGWKIKLRRPTDEEWSGMPIDDNGKIVIGREQMFDLVKTYVIGWDEVKHSDLVNGGLDEAAPFHPDLWTEVVSDNPDFWQPLGRAIIEAYQKHAEDSITEGKSS